MSVLGNIWRWVRAQLKQRREVEQLRFEHWVPPFNTVQAWQLGRPGVCWYCLQHRSQWSGPCPGRRPGPHVELA